MEERREISRVEYKTNGVVVICDTQEKNIRGRERHQSVRHGNLCAGGA